MGVGGGSGPPTWRFPNGQGFASGIRHKLKRMAEAASPGPQPTVPTAFLEVMPQEIGAPDCLIELEGPRGKMRIQWKGVTASDLAGFIRIWESA